MNELGLPGPPGHSDRKGRDPAMATARPVRVLLFVAAVSALGLSFFFTGGCGREVRPLRIARTPLPVISAGQGLLAFVGTDDTVYVWDGESAGAVHSGREVAGLALSPDPASPYLAILEPAAGTAVRDTDRTYLLTIVNLETGDSYPAFSPRCSRLEELRSECLRWSPDGRELFVHAYPPAVLAVGPQVATVAWDLTGLVPDGAFVRRPLPAPDFTRLAFTLFDWAAAEGEDLWVVDRPADSEGDTYDAAAARRRLTTGDRGGYPVCWIGSRADGSDPAGRPTYLLVQLGAISTGGGFPSGIAVVNADTGDMETWYPQSLTERDPLALDLERGRALIRVDYLDGERQGLSWRPLHDGAAQTAVDLPANVRIGSAVLLDDGSAVVTVGDPAASAGECWLVGGDGSSRKIGAGEKDETTHLLDGLLDGQAFVLRAVPDSGGGDAGYSPQLCRVNAQEGRLEPVDLIVLASKLGR